jgi:hypothetical protein
LNGEEDIFRFEQRNYFQKEIKWIIILDSNKLIRKYFISEKIKLSIFSN